MKKVNFQKFTSYGNNFVIVDEIRGQQLTEQEKSSFACHVTNVNFGIGADGVVFLQPYRSDILREINAIRYYWDMLPVFSNVEIIFRLFEPNGVESFSCGNGLMCVASYLYRQYNIASTKILTQVPRSPPTVVTIGTNPQKRKNWANMGSPGRVPQDIANPSNRRPFDGDIDIVNDISISFRAHDLHPFSDDTSLDLAGYLVYTGEPHLVIFPESGFSISDLKKVLFASYFQATQAGKPDERRMTFGSWLIHHVGMYINKRCTQLFPRGINVDFVNIPEERNILEYRCFERGINKETLACGTGALAVSFVSRRLELIKEKQLFVWPHRSRWYDPDAHIVVAEDNDHWFLYGKPIMLLEGIFMLDPLLSEQMAAVRSKSPDNEQRIKIEEENSFYPALIYH